MLTNTIPENDDLFYKRLNNSCDDLGLPKRGRAKKLNVLLGGKLSDKAVKKWLDNESFPTIANLNKIAAVLNVSPSWLGFGAKVKQESVKIDPLIKSVMLELTKKQKQITPKKIQSLLSIIDTWE